MLTFSRTGRSFSHPKINFQTPTKCIKTKEPVSVRCGIEFIDYEGRIDGESQTQLLNSIQPKEIIVVRSGLNIESYKRNLREKIASCQAGKPRG